MPDRDFYEEKIDIAQLSLHALSGSALEIDDVLLTDRTQAAIFAWQQGLIHRE